jgi:hypothetical protein
MIKFNPYKIKGSAGRPLDNGWYFVCVPEVKQYGAGFHWRINGFDYGFSVSIIAKAEGA